MNSDLYITSDLSLASLLSISYVLDHIDQTNQRRAVFAFRRDEGIDQLVEAFWSDQAQVSPRLYFSQIKYLKSRLYEERGQA